MEEVWEWDALCVRLLLPSGAINPCHLGGFALQRGEGDQSWGIFGPMSQCAHVLMRVLAFTT